MGASLGVDVRREPTDQLDPLVVRVDGLAQLCGAIALSHFAFDGVVGVVQAGVVGVVQAGAVRGGVVSVVAPRHGQPQRAGRTVRGDIDPTFGKHDVGERGHQHRVGRTAVLVPRKDPAAHRIILKGLVQQPDEQLPVFCARRPHRHTHVHPFVNQPWLYGG
ncbi:hypothetical protein SALBM311S_11427 [Streptomyces alboniger]